MQFDSYNYNQRPTYPAEKQAVIIIQRATTKWFNYAVNILQVALSKLQDYWFSVTKYLFVQETNNKLVLGGSYHACELFEVYYEVYCNK